MDAFDSRIDRAFELERAIVKAARDTSGEQWNLAGSLYEFQEAGGWGLLGYDTLNEFLAQPDLGLSRSKFFQLTRLWRVLVVKHEVPPPVLRGLDPSQVAIVLPAVVSGKVAVVDAIADVIALASRDLRVKYRKVKEGEGDELDAESEPQLEQCSSCGSWVPVQAPEVRDDPDQNERAGPQGDGYGCDGGGGS